MFGTLRNQLQKTIEDKTNEPSIKYSNWKMQIETWPGKVSTCIFCFYLFILKVSIKLYIKQGLYN